MKRMIKNRMNLKSRRITAAAVAALSAAAVVITSVLSGAIEVEAADTLLGIEKLRSRYMESGREFVILEIAPGRKAAQIGYLVDGYEPLLSEWDEEEQVWKSWRNTLCELPKTKRKDFIEGKKEELRKYYQEHGLTEEFPVDAVEAEYEEGEPQQEGFEKIVSDGSKSTGWFQKLGGTPAAGTDRYQIAFRYEGKYNNSYEFYEDVLYYNVLSATKIDENLVGGIEDDRPIYTKEEEGVYQYCGTWGEVNGAVRTAIAEEDSREEPDDEEAEEDEKLSDKAVSAIMSVAMVIGIVIAVGLFVILPKKLVPLIHPLTANRILQSFAEGILKIILFILYLSATLLMKDQRRTYEYHGAEHKTIACLEAGLELNVENVKKQRRFHPRCGTSFIFITLIISILVMCMVPFREPWLRVVSSLILLPVMVGISYELIRIAGRYTNTFTRIISAPGLWIQRLTTREPDASQIETAIAAIKPCIPENPEEDKW